MQPYWIDADVLIQAINLYYPFKRVAKFWVFLSQQVEAGVIRSSRLVWQEVCAGDDELAEWLSNRRESGLCVSASRATQAEYAQISEYVFNTYRPHQAAEFLRGGDGWVIAHAMETSGTVTTQESAKSKKARIKIPTVCKALGVRCLDTFRMLDELKAGPF
jgi:hypothetical protein